MLRFLLACTLLVTAFATSASAQTTTHALQLSGEYSALGLYRESDLGIGVSGFGVRADYRLTRRVDVEGRVLWFPTNALQEFEAQGGQTTQLALGVRGKFLQWKRASFYGVLLPELLHFSNAFIDIGGGDAVTGGATHFALDWGIGAEVKAGDRWSVHFDTTGPLYAIRETEPSCSEPGPSGAILCGSLAPRIVNVWQISGGVSYSVGPIRHEMEEEAVSGVWEVGGQVGATTTAGALTTNLRTVVALGGFASLRLFPATYADASMSFSPRDVRTRTSWDGGHLTQAVAGVKVGPRKDAYGIFGKVRVGINSHSGAVRAVGPAGFALSRANSLIVDLGAVVERYLPKRMLVRFDAGDALSVYERTTYTHAGVVVPEPAPSPTHSLQTTVGIGWRF